MKPYQIQLILAAIAATGMNAQDETTPSDRRPPPPVLFAALDADEDGKISIAEIQSAAEGLAKLDQNGDGEITIDELRPPHPEGETSPPDDGRPQGPPPRFGPPPVITALDADKNNTISNSELENAPESLKQLDKDADGELSPEEIHPHGPPPPHESGQGPRHQGHPPEDQDPGVE